MRNSCVVCSLAVTLCFVVCVYANDKVSKADAARAVEEAKESVTKVCAKAQKELNDANSILQKVESSKEDAAQAYSQAKQAATGNTKAEEIANTIKSLSEAINNMYQDPKGKMDTAVNSLTTMRAEAQVLEGKVDITITSNEGSEDDFTDTKGKAKDLKGQADALDKKITAALQPINGLGATANAMAKKATEAQLKDYHVSAIVAVAKIESMLGKAETIIRQIEAKKNTVSGIVHEMKTLKPNPPVVPDANITTLHKSAADALTAATGAVDNAKGAKAQIQAQQGIANAALTKVKAENQEMSDAKGEVNKAEACVTAAEKIAPQLDTALQTVEESLTNANDSKEQLQAALSKATTVQNTDQSVIHSQVKPLQDSVIADFNAIQTMIEETDGTLQETEKHKRAVHDIVQEMKKHCTNDLIEAYDILKEQCQSATEALTTAKGAVDEAQNAVSAMKEQKGLADTALENVQKTDTNVINAEAAANAAKTCVSTAEQNVVQLNNALEAAKASVTKANNAKQEIKTAMSKATREERTKQTKEKEEKTNPPVVDGTNSYQTNPTIQPTIISTAQPTSKELPDQSNNSTDKLKDALINSAHNVPTTALTGGKAPAPGANNDSAMTVSVPLLVALIASAVLQ